MYGRKEFHTRKGERESKRQTDVVVVRLFRLGFNSFVVRRIEEGEEKE